MTVSQDIERVSSTIKRQWSEGDNVDTIVALPKYSNLNDCKPLVLDLAYEEYCHRAAIGDVVEVRSFCQKFPQCQSSLHRRIETHQLLSENPDLLDNVVEPDWPQIDEDVLKFHLVEELGRGAMGRVYLAEQSELADRRVVVKLSAYGNQEAHMLGRLEHPNVVAVHAFDEDDERGIHVICMPFLGRTTLDDFLDVAFESGYPPDRISVVLDRLLDLHPADEREQFTKQAERLPRHSSYIDGVITLATGVADALEHTHGRSVFHLDLKPSNVLLSPTGHPTLLDFNLSLDTTDEARLAGGTLPYMAPEQIRATVFQATTDDAKIDQRCDIYSTGVLLYQLLVGDHPFGPISWNRQRLLVAEELLSYQQQGPNTATLRAMGVDRETVRVVNRCLTFDPSKRYQSAGELATDLRRCVSRRRRFRRWRTANRSSVASLILFFAVILAGISFGFATRSSPEERWVTLAQTSLDAGDLTEAFTCVESALQANNDSVDAWFLRGQIQRAQRKFPEACRDFAHALKLEPSPKHHVALGDCYVRCRSFNMAKKHLHKAMNAGYESAEVYNLLGYISHRKGNFDDAEQWYEEAVTLDPDFASGWYNRANNELVVCLNRRLVASAASVQYIEKAIATSNRAPNALYFAAHMLFHADRSTQNRVPTILKYLEESIVNGFSKRVVRRWLDYPEFENDPRIQNLANTPVKVVVSRPILRILPIPLDN